MFGDSTTQGVSEMASPNSIVRALCRKVSQKSEKIYASIIENLKKETKMFYEEFTLGLIMRGVFIVLLIAFLFKNKKPKLPKPHWAFGLLVVGWYFLYNTDYNDAFFVLGFVFPDFWGIIRSSITKYFPIMFKLTEVKPKEKKKVVTEYVEPEGRW